MWIPLVFHTCSYGAFPIVCPVAFLCLFFSFSVTKYLKGTCVGCSLVFGMQLVFHFCSFISSTLLHNWIKTVKALLLDHWYWISTKIRSYSSYSSQYLWKFSDNQHIYTWPWEEGWGEKGEMKIKGGQKTGEGAGEPPQGKERLKVLSVDISIMFKRRLRILSCPVDHKQNIH